MLKNLFSSGQTWHKEYLLNYATIEFPKKPQLIKSSNGLTQIGYNGGINFYIVDIENLSNYGLDVKPNEVNDLYNGILVGFFEKPDKKALVKKEFSVSNLTGIEIIYSAEGSNAPDLRYKRLLFFNGKIFSYEFWTTFSNEENSKKDRDRYFDSFTIILNKSILQQYTIK
jgi:hypothetical protein